LLVLGAGVFLFMRNKKRKLKHNEHRATTADAAPSLEEAKAKLELEAANSAAKMQAAVAERLAEQRQADLASLAALKLPASTTQKGELLTNEIRENTKKDPTVPAHVIQTWLREE
jgi:flagellar biosynthesis/type III secretory pathway M-ring protein FliF/YscJ